MVTALTVMMASGMSSDNQVWAGAIPNNICERNLMSASKRHKIPPGLLYAIGLTESGYKGKLHPYALNVEGKSFFPKSASEALKIYQRETEKGKKLIDLGCMQINFKYHGHAFASLSAMLDPVQNVDYAARFLKRLRQRHGSWSVAIARYHAGDKNHRAQKRYVCHVLNHLVLTGFAKRTQNVQNLCKSTG